MAICISRNAAPKAPQIYIVCVPGKQPAQPPGHLAFFHGGRRFTVPIVDQLFIGRECAGIGAAGRLVINEPDISRTHLEIRLDTAADAAFLIDTSTNGTRAPLVAGPEASSICSAAAAPPPPARSADW